ncbi:Tar ligand binding domain-containing protein [Cupriavidus basilensis]
MMKNLSVRTALLGILVTFACMIVFGAGVGVLALGAANQATGRVQQLSATTLLLNDAYKDMTRARAALARAYTTAREVVPGSMPAHLMPPPKPLEIPPGRCSASRPRPRRKSRTRPCAARSPTPRGAMPAR